MELIIMGVSVVLASDDVRVAVNNGSVSSAPLAHGEHITWRDMANDDHIVAFLLR